MVVGVIDDLNLLSSISCILVYVLVISFDLHCPASDIGIPFLCQPTHWREVSVEGAGETLDWKGAVHLGSVIESLLL